MYCAMDRRLLLAVPLCALLIALWGAHHRAGASDGPEITPAVRAAGLRLAPEVAPRDREWVQAAIARARPEARQLIDAVDGLVEVRTVSEHGPWVGLMEPTGPQSYRITFDISYLDGDEKLTRDQAVLHELGHVISAALVDPALRDRLAASIPTTGQCFVAESGDCAVPEERFADTFAKWALRGAVSSVAGYGVAAPASLEDWGAPLAALAVQVTASSSTT